MTAPRKAVQDKETKRTIDAGPLIGSHMSISGGVQEALIRGRDLDCRTIQIFTKNATQWKSKALSPDTVEAFKNMQKESGIAPIVVHDSYLINIASPEPKKRAMSRQALLEEMQRTEALGIPYLVMHPGAHMGAGEQEGIEQIVKSLNTLHQKTEGYGMKILLETTAGQGTNLGYRFEQIEQMISSVHEPERLGVCVDTCHIFAAGYDIRTAQGYEETTEQLLDVFGLPAILCIHVNDSLKEYESRVDRHAHIGEGKIGLEAFRCLMNDPRFESVPKILETPKDKKDEMDRKNLAVLRNLVR